MSISSQPFKRRRLDPGSSGLSKPFKSPLRTTPVSQDQEVNLAAVDSRHQPVTRQNNQTAITPSRRPNPNVSFISKAAIKPPPPPPYPKQDPQETALQKQHTALLLQLTQLRRSLDTAQQALKLTSSPRETELESLIAKWKLASREAAEEVFQGAEDRVNQMGGVGAWRERSRENKAGWGDDEQAASNGRLSGEQREEREIQREELETERKKYGMEGTEEEVVERDDEDVSWRWMVSRLPPILMC